MIRPVGRFEIGRHWWRLLTVVIDGLSLNGFVAIKRGFLAKSPLLLANWNCRRPARRPDSRLTGVVDVLALGPLALVSRNAEDDGVAMRLGGRGLDVALCLRELGCNVELATALNATTFVGRFAVRDVEGRGFGTHYMVHDGDVGDLGICTAGKWGESAVLVGVLGSMLTDRGWLVCDGGLGRTGLDIVGEAAADRGLQAVGMGAGGEGAVLVAGERLWRGLCMDRGGWWAASGGDGRLSDEGYVGLSETLGKVALRVEVGNGVALTLRSGSVLGYGVWRGLAVETAALTDWLMG